MASHQPQERPGAQRNTTTKAGSHKVLVVIDGSERTGRVIEYALGLARDGRGVEGLLLAIVAEPPNGRLRGYGSFKRDEIHARLADVLGRRAVEAAARRFDQAGIAHKNRIEVGAPAETILRVAAQEGCDVVVVGEFPAGAFRQWLPKVIGLAVSTVATQVAQFAAVPVVVVK